LKLKKTPSFGFDLQRQLKLEKKTTTRESLIDSWSDADSQYLKILKRARVDANRFVCDLRQSSSAFAFFVAKT
jgi:hypothetical protein